MVDTNIQERVNRAARAYIYGYPLVYSMDEVPKIPAGTSGIAPQAAYNSFGLARRLLDPSAIIVSPNNDTLYMISICDVRQGPLVLQVPDTSERYTVLQFVDMWTNNFAYIGRRATGTAAAQYLLVEAGYQGPVPNGMTIVRAPTGVFVILGRVAVSGEADLPAAHALQDQFTLTPLSVFQGGEAPLVAGVPQPDARVGDALRFWEEFRVALNAFPPPASDAPFLAICEELGLTAAMSPYINPDPSLAQVLVAGAAAGQSKIEELGKAASTPINGWQYSTHLFDFNQEFFEIGTINSPEWIIQDRLTAYVTRAVLARIGLWGNHGYEAVYAQVWVDADNNPLTSDHQYELKLSIAPPVDAFWSLTMYEVPDFYLVANPIERYSIGSETPGLKYGTDGSLTIYMQKDSPGADKEPNWLPTPTAAAFRPIMRMYTPRQEILNGAYVIPAIQKKE